MSTNNQTIDGVPRKLLTSLLAWLERANERNGDGDIAEYVELRALLDAPAATSKLVGAAQYWSENEKVLRDVCRFEGLKGLVYQVVRDREKPAAQPQGEPVAWRYRDGNGGQWRLTDMPPSTWYFDPAQYEVRKLYEQPAPVAAKHTMRSIMEAVELSSEFTVLTSNQCAALAAVLNSNRRPPTPIHRQAPSHPARTTTTMGLMSGGNHEPC